MKMMDASAYARYRRILGTLRARGTRPGFLELGLTADLVIAQEAGNEEEVERCRTRLELTVEEVT